MVCGSVSVSTNVNFTFTKINVCQVKSFVDKKITCNRF